MIAALACPKCRMALNPVDYPPDEFRECTNCGAALRMEEFPALRRPAATGQAAEAILIEGEAGCFYHPGKKAVVPCAACGRFLCALCDIELGDQHLCPNCIETSRQKNTLAALESSRFLYDELALSLSVISLLICGILAPVAMYIGIRHWKKPGSLTSRVRWKIPLALVLSVAQLGFLIFVVVQAIMEG